VTGKYHDIGAFRLIYQSFKVTLNNLSIAPGKDGNLILDTTAKTFRYLDVEGSLSAEKSATAVG
jgi:type IV pilus assembly protein PilO